MSLNKVLLIGNLGADPESRFSQDGSTQIVSMRVATSRRRKDQAGNWVDETDWHNVRVLGRQAEFAAKYFRKGSSIFVEGRLQTRKYTGRDGQERYYTEVVAEDVQFAGGRRQEGGAPSDADDGFNRGSYQRQAPAAQAAPRPATRPAAAPRNEAPAPQPAPSHYGDGGDDIPF